MKLRIKANSIRLRLGRSEVERLIGVGVVEESATFDPTGRQRLVYRLLASAEVAEVVASFTDSRLDVRIPLDRATAWCRSGEIGISAEQAIAGGSTLRILIEKDLECLDAPPEESQADAFRRAEGAGPCGPAVTLEPGRTPA